MEVDSRLEVLQVAEAVGHLLDLGLAGLPSGARRTGERRGGELPAGAVGAARDTALCVQWWIKNPKNPKTVPTLRHASRLLHFHVTVNNVGRSALGAASSHVGLSATTRDLLPLLGARGADRVCQPEAADHAPAAPADTAPGDGAPRGVPRSSSRRHRRLLLPSRPLRRGRIDQHDHQSGPPTRTRYMQDEQLLLLKLEAGHGSSDPIVSRPGALLETSTAVKIEGFHHS